MKILSRDENLSNLNDMTFISGREARIMLPELEKLPKKGRALELGTGKGHSTVFFSHALPGWTIYTVDAYGSAGTPPLMYGGGELVFDPTGVNQVRSYLKENSTGNHIQIVGSFDDLPWELPIDLLFIDGSHWYADIKKDWEKYSPFLTKDGLALMHDYNYTYGVQEFFETEVIPEGKWDIIREETIGIARRI